VPLIQGSASRRVGRNEDIRLAHEDQTWRRQSPNVEKSERAGCARGALNSGNKDINLLAGDVRQVQRSTSVVNIV
jgi:hypothetical protein